MKSKFIFYVGYETINTKKYKYTYTNILDFVTNEKEAKQWVDWLREVYKKVKNEKKR